MVIFHSYVNVYQRVPSQKPWWLENSLKQVTNRLKHLFRATWWNLECARCRETRPVPAPLCSTNKSVTSPGGRQGKVASCTRDAVFILGFQWNTGTIVIFWNFGMPMVFHWNPNIMNIVINIWWDCNGILPILPSLGLLSIHSMDDLTKTNMGCQPETKLGTILGNMGLYSNQILGF